MKLEIATRHPKKKVQKSRVEQVVIYCSKQMLPSNSVISVAFLDDLEMTPVNESYTGRKGTTDVLSFPLGVDDFDSKWYGEIVISLDRASKQAKEKNVTLMQEVVRLLVHSVVHLAGFDHYSLDTFKEMRKAEFSLLADCLAL